MHQNASFHTVAAAAAAAAEHVSQHVAFAASTHTHTRTPHVHTTNPALDLRASAAPPSAPVLAIVGQGVSACCVQSARRLRRIAVIFEAFAYPIGSTRLAQPPDTAARGRAAPCVHLCLGGGASVTISSRIRSPRFEYGRLASPNATSCALRPRIIAAASRRTAFRVCSTNTDRALSVFGLASYWQQCFVRDGPMNGAVSGCASKSRTHKKVGQAGESMYGTMTMCE